MSEFEDRVSALEADVAELKERIASRPQSRNWIKAVSGSMKDEPAFDEVLKLGRAFRESQNGASDTDDGGR